jgi:hypothetical protein
MGVYKLSANSVKNGRTVYGSMLAGNTAFQPTHFESIATTTVGSGGGGTSVSFSNIPSTYTHLQIRCSAQTNRGTYGTDSYYMRFNSDTGSNYNYGYLRGNGSAMAAYHYNSAQSLIEVGSASGTTNSSSFGGAVIDILDYTKQ